MKLVKVDIDIDDLRDICEQYMIFAAKMEHSVDDKFPLVFLNKCPVSTQMLGAGIIAIVQQLKLSQAIDEETLRALVGNLSGMIEGELDGPKRSAMLM